MQKTDTTLNPYLAFNGKCMPPLHSEMRLLWLRTGWSMRNLKKIDQAGNMG